MVTVVGERFVSLVGMKQVAKKENKIKQKERLETDM